MSEPKILKKKAASELSSTLEKIKNRVACSPKQLTMSWAEEERSCPNELFRCLLFFPRQDRGERAQFKDVLLFSLGTAEVTYRGEELRVSDEDVWLQIMHLARAHNLGEPVEFSPYSFIKALGWSKSKKTGIIQRPSETHYRRLKKCLSRMSATNLTLKTKERTLDMLPDKGISFSLIQKYEWRETKLWRVWVDEEMKMLFGEKSFTKVEWEQRMMLTPTAKKLQGYFSSHKIPHPVRVENLQKLCDAKAGLPQFKQKLRGYLDELVNVGFLKKCSINNNLVRVSRIRLVKQVS